MTCADVGCGGGDATLELAKRVAPRGNVFGFDIDEDKLAIARAEAQQLGMANVQFEACDVRTSAGRQPFDAVYARFLLTHLNDPAGVVGKFFNHVKPGGMVAVEDIDFSGYFTHPKNRAFDRYVEIYSTAVRRRGGDPNIGPRLPSLLLGAGFVDVGVHVVQPVGLQGDAKVINALTMENIAGPVIQDGLATREEIDELVRELYDFAADPTTVAGTPRIEPLMTVLSSGINSPAPTGRPARRRAPRRSGRGTGAGPAPARRSARIRA